MYICSLKWGFGHIICLIPLNAGDNPPHDFWNETKEGQLASTKLIVDKVTSHLPGKTIYPTIGNHGELHVL